MLKTTFIFSLLLGILASVFGQPSQTVCPYAKYAGPNVVHTACLPPNTSCTIVNTGVTNDEQTLILKLHNDIRNKVAGGQQTGAGNFQLPQAADMRQLNWNEELAKIAQAHANQCSLSPDCYRCRSIESYETGENIFYQFEDSVPKRNNWPAAIAYWEQFSKDLRSVKAYQYTFSAFTQMIWALTKDIGCAVTRFKGTQYKYVAYYVCLYGPAGNYADKNVYQVGAPCTDCTFKDTCCGNSCINDGRTVDYQNLCKSTLTMN